MNRKLKILIIPGWFPGPLSSHTGDFVLKQAKDLVELGGMDVTVAYPDFSYRYWAQADHWMPETVVENIAGVKIYRRSGLGFPRLLPFVFRLWRQRAIRFVETVIAAEGQPDVVHAHTFLGGFLATGLKKRYDHLPVIITEHSDLLITKITGRLMGIIKEAYQSSDAIIAPSHFLQEAMLPWTDQTGTHVIPLSVNERIFKPSTLPSKMGKVLQLITVCELVPAKNLPLLLKSVAHLMTHGHPASLTIVGDGPESRSLHALTKQLNITGAVNFVGWKNPHEVAELLQRADIYGCTSHKETFGLSMLEALTCGIPVVSTNCGGPQDFINTHNGLVVEADPKAFAEATLEITCRQLKRTGESLVNPNQFGSEAVVHHLAETYHMLLR